jgi:hypothetical protein
MIQFYSLGLAIIELLGRALLTGDISAAILATLIILTRAVRGLLAAVENGIGRGSRRYSPPDAPTGDTPNPACRTLALKLALSIIAIVATANSGAAAENEGPFMAENSSAMSKMMAAMDVKPTGDVDADFVAMMTPHHQGAIDMAKAELSYGHNELLRRMAQEIIVTQQQEIRAMQLALSKPPMPSMPPPDQLSHDRRQEEPSMPHSIMHN